MRVEVGGNQVWTVFTAWFLMFLRSSFIPVFGFNETPQAPFYDFYFFINYKLEFNPLQSVKVAHNNITTLCLRT